MKSFIGKIPAIFVVVALGCTPVQRGLFLGTSPYTEQYDVYFDECVGRVSTLKIEIAGREMEFCQCFSQRRMFYDEDNKATGYQPSTGIQMDDLVVIARECASFIVRTPISAMSQINNSVLRGMK